MSETWASGATAAVRSEGRSSALARTVADGRVDLTDTKRLPRRSQISPFSFSKSWHLLHVLGQTHLQGPGEGCQLLQVTCTVITEVVRVCAGSPLSLWVLVCLFRLQCVFAPPASHPAFSPPTSPPDRPPDTQRQQPSSSVFTSPTAMTVHSLQ